MQILHVLLKMDGFDQVNASKNAIKYVEYTGSTLSLYLPLITEVINGLLQMDFYAIPNQPQMLPKILDLVPKFYKYSSVSVLITRDYQK